LEGEAEPRGEETLRSAALMIVRLWVPEGREGSRDGRRVLAGSSEGEPERSKAQESKGPDPN
jgi:hypothetical protein